MTNSTNSTTIYHKQPPDLADQLMHLRAWEDPVADPQGHHPRSLYVELFWLPTLGPTAVWFLRRASLLLEHCPSGYSMPKQHLAQELGLGGWQGANSPFWRAVQRCRDFNLVHLGPNNIVFVRQSIPDLPSRLVKKLPIRLKLLHADWHSTGPARQDRAF